MERVNVIILHGISAEREPGWHRPVARAVRDANPGLDCYFFPITWERVRDRHVDTGGEVTDYLSDLSVIFDMEVLGWIYRSVTEVLTEHPGARTMVVGHSYGSVLGYMLAHALDAMRVDPSVRIERFVTIGSPIWIAERGPLKRVFRRPSKPRRVGQWINVTGLFDPVTLFGLGRIKAADRNLLALCDHDLDRYSRSTAAAAAFTLPRPGANALYREQVSSANRDNEGDDADDAS